MSNSDRRTPRRARRKVVGCRLAKAETREKADRFEAEGEADVGVDPRRRRVVLNRRVIVAENLTDATLEPQAAIRNVERRAHEAMRDWSARGSGDAREL